MIKFTKPSSGPFRNTTPEALVRRCVDEILTPGGAGSPFVMVGTGYGKDEPLTNDDPLTKLTIDVDDEQVELLVDEKAWRNALRAALAEIDDAV